MPELRLRLDRDVSGSDAAPGYAPGDTITVTLHWDLAEPPRNLCCNLLWYTEGKGDDNIEVIHRETISDPGPRGEAQLHFTAPAFPYSFSGHLISLIWAMEAVAENPDAVERIPLVIAPAGVEIRL